MRPLTSGLRWIDNEQMAIKKSELYGLASAQSPRLTEAGIKAPMVADQGLTAKVAAHLKNMGFRFLP